MKIVKLANDMKDVKDWDKMVDWFEKRTNNHIKLVQKYCELVADYDPVFEELIERGEVHDASKFEEPEMTPYVWTTWQYKCKDDGIKLEIPEDIKEKMNAATFHHVKHNKHHPENHTEQSKDILNREDRDKPPSEIIDATKMEDIDIGELVCDWMAMAEEKGTNPKDWADKNVNIRWKFTNKQKDLIYDLIKNIWKK